MARNGFVVRVMRRAAAGVAAVGLVAVSVLAVGGGAQANGWSSPGAVELYNPWYTQIVSNTAGAGYWVKQSYQQWNPWNWSAVLPEAGAPAIPGVPTDSDLTPDGYVTVMPDGQGAYIVSSDGGIQAYGDADQSLQGELSKMTAYDLQIVSLDPNQVFTLNPIQGAAVTPSGKGLWILDHLGSVWAIGDAVDLNAGPRWLNTDYIDGATDIAADEEGTGYLVLDSTGEVHGYGTATSFGGPTVTGGDKAVALTMTTDGGGYWVLEDNGTVTAWGDAPDLGVTVDGSATFLNSTKFSDIATNYGATGGFYRIQENGAVSQTMACGYTQQVIAYESSPVVVPGPSCAGFAGGTYTVGTPFPSGVGTVSAANAADGSFTFTAASDLESDYNAYVPVTVTDPSGRTDQFNAPIWVINSIVVSADGQAHTITAPDGVVSMSFFLTGGSGGNTSAPDNSGNGGYGALLSGTVAAQPGQQFLMSAGGAGGDGTDATSGGAPGVSGFPQYVGGAGGDADTDSQNPGTGAGGGSASVILNADGSVVAIGGGGGGGGGKAENGEFDYQSGNGGAAGSTPDDGSEGSGPSHGGAGKGGYFDTPQGGTGYSSEGWGGGGGGGGGYRGGSAGTNGGSSDLDGSGGGGGAAAAYLAPGIADGDINTQDQPGDGSIKYSWTYQNIAPTLTDDTLPATIPSGAPFSYQFTATGYPLPAFSVDPSSALPPGMTLTPDGLLSGTPTSSGDYVIQIDATNSSGAVAGQPHGVTVTAAPALTQATPPDGVVGTPYSYTVQATGFPAPTYSVIGDLPPGLTLNPTTGVLAGTPTEDDNYMFTLVASNSVGEASYETIMDITPQLTAPTFQNDSPPGQAMLGIAFSYSFAASGYPTPTYSVGSGNLPPGLTLDPGTGIVSGTATTTGSYAYQITASNSQGTTSSSPHTMAVLSEPQFINASPPASTPFTFPYWGYQFTALPDALAPITYGIASGSLPPGMTLSPSGYLDGTPLQAGTFTYSVVASVYSTYAIAGPFTLTVAIPPTAPQNVTATPGDGQATISWTASTPGTSPISFYSVTELNTETEVAQVDPTTTSVVITGLSNGVTYSFSVNAWALDYNSSSSVVSVTPQALTGSEEHPATEPTETPQPTDSTPPKPSDVTHPRSALPHQSTPGADSTQLAATGTTLVPLEITVAAIITTTAGAALYMLVHRRRAAKHVNAE